LFAERLPGCLFPSTSLSEASVPDDDAFARSDDLDQLLDDSASTFATACGVLMVRMEVSDDEAASYLVRTAQVLGVEQTALAEMVVRHCCLRSRRTA
jgi:ANTAR domain